MTDETDNEYQALYGVPDKPTLSDEDEATFRALYPEHTTTPLDPDAQAAYDAVYDWSNVPVHQRPEHARPHN